MSGDYKQKLKQRLPITRLLEFYGARHVSSDLYHCHPNLGHASEDKHPSLIANDARGVAKCLGNCALNQGSSDIFEVIKRAEKCNFNDALKRAGEIANLPEFGQESARPSQRPFKKKKGLDNKDLNRVPKVYALEERHQAWLEQRFSAEWRWLADYFNIKAWHYHIAVPIDRSEVNWVFIPLDKQKDQTFYRGPSRSVQPFPNWPWEHGQTKHVIKCEGEKDVLRLYAEFHKRNLLNDWAAVTNTNGAQSLRPETGIFKNFEPRRVKSVLISHDNDAAGRQANKTARQMAKDYFDQGTKIKVLQFASSIKGYDISDFLNEGKTFLPKDQLELFNSRQEETGLAQGIQISLSSRNKSWNS